MKQYILWCIIVTGTCFGMEQQKPQPPGFTINLPWGEIQQNVTKTIRDLIQDGTLEKPLTHALKTVGITSVGISGAIGGTFLTVKGWQKFLTDEPNLLGKPFYETNMARGLITASFGLCTTAASAYLILKSNHIAAYYS